MNSVNTPTRNMAVQDLQNEVLASKLRDQNLANYTVMEPSMDEIETKDEGKFIFMTNFRKVKSTKIKPWECFTTWLRS